MSRLFPWIVKRPPSWIAAGLGAVLLSAAIPSEEDLRADRIGATDPGIPVTSELVVQNCVACHPMDDQGRMSRISYMRKTPEGWQESLLRMVALQGLEIDPETAREVVRYLSDEHGLAPEELRPSLWAVERRTSADPYPHEVTRQTCAACHSVGRAVTQRRTEEEWTLLTETHRGYYPLVDNQVFRSGRGGPFPVEEVIQHLSETYPLATAEWAEWSAAVRASRIEGRWAIEGWEVGKGPVFGTMEVAPVPGREGEFATRTSYVYARDGTRIVREGDVRVYTGYQWRGRSLAAEATGTGNTPAAGTARELREVMFVERDGSQIQGRWFTGGYDELGLDVELRRVGADPVLMGAYPRALRTGGEEQEIGIYGANLPAQPNVADLDLGAGVEVLAVEPAGADGLRVRLRVNAGARPGFRDLRLAGRTLPRAVVLFDRVDYLQVEPEAGMARVGGIAMPKQYERFEAIGYHAGADGEPGTDDDIRLGPMEVTWDLAEYPLTYSDDDVPFVGVIDEEGLFTPAEDGPNPERPGNRSNMGDVWVVATYTPSGGDTPTLEARGYLLVTTPAYIRWDPDRVMEGPEAGPTAASPAPR